MAGMLAEKGSPDDIKLYTRRWILMAVFIYYTISCGVHWVEFTSITNVMTRYYDVPAVWVEWTTIVYMVSYTICVVPTLYVIDRIVSTKLSLVVLALISCQFNARKSTLLGCEEQSDSGGGGHRCWSGHQMFFSSAGQILPGDDRPSIRRRFHHVHVRSGGTFHRPLVWQPRDQPSGRLNITGRSSKNAIEDFTT